MKLTFDQQVTRALKVLGPRAERADVEEEVRSLERPPLQRSLPRLYYLARPRTKKEKLVAQQLRNALYRVNTLLARCNFAHPPKKEWLKELERLERAADAVTKCRLRSPGRSDRQRMRAVYAAARLLGDVDAALTVTRADPERGARGSKFVQLAAILNGDDSVNFYHLCERYKARNRDAK
jgi:hypothetical protein